MNEMGLEKLHPLLFGREEKLVNVKFFPGSDPRVTVDQLANAAADMIQATCNAWKKGNPSNPPETNMPKVPLLG